VPGHRVRRHRTRLPGRRGPRREARPGGRGRRAHVRRGRSLPRRPRHRRLTARRRAMPDIVPSPTGPLAGRKIAVLMESDYVEQEIFYYERRFAEEGADVHFLTRMWGQPSLTFTGHEHRVPFSVDRSFEDVDVASYDVIIVP